MVAAVRVGKQRRAGGAVFRDAARYAFSPSLSPRKKQRAISWCAHRPPVVVPRLLTHATRARPLFALQVHPSQPLPDVDCLPVPAVRGLREAAPVRETQHGHPVPHILLPAGELPAVPRGARVEAAVLAVPQEVHDVVPGVCLCVRRVNEGGMISASHTLVVLRRLCICMCLL